MNFKEFEELISSGAKEIILTKDVILEDSIEINTDGLVIDGNGHAIDANNNSCIFEVSAKNITLKNVTLKNADCLDGRGAINVYDNAGLKVVNVRFCKNASSYGGAIMNEGNVEIIGSVFEDNQAKSGGAIANRRHMKISDCEFTNNNAETAGAIDNDHTLTIKDSLFNKNTSENGGAIINDSKIVLTDCRFKDNSAQRGGSIINQENGDFNIVKSNFTDNSAESDGIIINDGGKFKINDSKFKNNRCGDGAIVNNLEGLLKIKDATFTDNFPGKDYLSLNSSKNAELKAKYIKYENDNPLDKDEIIYDADYFNELIENGIREIALESDMTFHKDEQILIDVDNVLIDGKGHVIDANKIHRGFSGIFEVSSKNIILKHITFKNSLGNCVIEVCEESSLKVIKCEFIENWFLEYEGYGAAIYNRGEAEVISCVFDENGGWSRKHYGGAICTYGKMGIVKSVFSNNKAGFGGAIENDGELTISNSRFEGNYSSRSGGAIYNYEVLIINNSRFNENEADWAAGAIFNHNTYSCLQINKTIFLRNSSGAGYYGNWNGGAISNYGKLMIDNSQFIENDSNRNGGAIYNDGPLHITKSKFIKNYASYNGQSIYSNNPEDTLIDDSCEFKQWFKKDHEIFYRDSQDDDLPDFKRRTGVKANRNSNYLKEFERMNVTTKSIYDLDVFDVLIVLKDGTNLTDWDDVRDKEDILYVCEDLTRCDKYKDRYAGLKSLKAIVAFGGNDIEDMAYMFEDCKSLTEVHLGSLDVSKSKHMQFMFSGCESLVDISSLSNWNTSNVEGMQFMFSGCESLMDCSCLSYWNVENANVERMFKGCDSLEKYPKWYK